MTPHENQHWLPFVLGSPNGKDPTVSMSVTKTASGWVRRFFLLHEGLARSKAPRFSFKGQIICGCVGVDLPFFPSMLVSNGKKSQRPFWTAPACLCWERSGPAGRRVNLAGMQFSFGFRCVKEHQCGCRAFFHTLFGLKGKRTVGILMLIEACMCQPFFGGLL